MKKPKRNAKGGRCTGREVPPPPIDHYKELLNDRLKFKQDKEDLWKQIVTASISAGGNIMQAANTADRAVAGWEVRFHSKQD